MRKEQETEEERNQNDIEYREWLSAQNDNELNPKNYPTENP